MNFPTQLTVLRIILTPIFLFFLLADGFIFKLIAFLIFIFASFTDFYDGYFAKKYGYVTLWGRFLDPLADKILISTAFIAFYFLGYVQLWVVIVMIVRDFLVTLLRSYAMFKKHSIVTAYVARVKTLVQVISSYVVFVFLLVDQLLKSYQIEFFIINFLKKIYFIDILMTIVALLTAYTGIKYFINNRFQISLFWKDCCSIFKSSDQ